MKKQPGAGLSALLSVVGTLSLFGFLNLSPINGPAVWAGEVVGVTVTPHVIADSMKYRRPRDPDLGAKVQLFIKGSALPATFNGSSGKELLSTGDWAWHDLDTAVRGPDDSLSVWTWNGKSSAWGAGNDVDVAGDGLPDTRFSITNPERWISNITFLSSGNSIAPDQVVLHVVNQTDSPLSVSSLRIWLPKTASTWQTMFAMEPLVLETEIPPQDRGIVQVTLNEPLPLTYTAIELQTNQGLLWEHLRIKTEHFDISGGWIGDHLREESYLRLLKHLHVNCGQIQGVPGFTDNPELYNRYPIKLFNRMWPLEEWDTEEWLPKIHAVEFLGEPQYGGGRPVAPQEVFEKFLPYRSSRLATSVTHSEERIWRYYAGLSDYPHYDAYRVVAPAADSWRSYDRWNGKQISWGAPLETIGDMCRSLRELNRPMPVAYWSQGPHDGWGSGFRLSARARRSPTPDELRSQAMHALSTRITSLYWFNLSLKSLMKFPDTWDSIQRIGREIRILEPFYLSGDAFEFNRIRNSEGRLDWDCSSIVCKDCALLFANDLAYQPDETDSTFHFGDPRAFDHVYRLPHWLQNPTDVFRVDADGVHPVHWSAADTGVRIQETISRDGIFVATRNPGLRTEIESRRQIALQEESQNDIDMNALDALLKSGGNK